MTLRATLSGDLVLLEMENREAVRQFFDAAEAQKGFLLALASAPKLFSTLTLRIVRPADLSFEFRAQVIQAFEQGAGAVAVAFQLQGWDDESRDHLVQRLAPSSETASQGQPEREVGQGSEPAPREGAGDEEQAEPEGEAGDDADETPPDSTTMGTSPVFRIKGMNISERSRLATKANRTERQILLRDGSPQILMGLLSNPRVERDDILQIVKSPYATGAILKRVAEDRRWNLNQEIRTAIVRNPKTPTPLAVRLLDSLTTPELGALAKLAAAREELRKAALRIYLKRTSRR